MDILKNFATVWPLILLLGGALAVVLAWFATREMRKKTGAAQAEMVQVFRDTITAKDALALVTAEATAKQLQILAEEKKIVVATAADQIRLLTAARTESDTRNEAVIADYREKLHTVREEFQAAVSSHSECKAALAELKGRTDFGPVMEFQQTWHRESKEIHAQMLTTSQQMIASVQVMAPILREAIEVLKKFGNAPQDVHIVGTDTDPVHTKPAPGT